VFVCVVHLGVAYPDCDLCGLCYDSLATRIDALASDVERSYLSVVDFWSRYYSQSLPSFRRFAVHFAGRIGCVA